MRSEVVAPGVLAEVLEGEDLVEAGKRRELGQRRWRRPPPSPRRSTRYDRDVRPRLLEAASPIELLGFEARRHLRDRVPERCVEDVGQRVGSVGRQDECAVAALRGVDRGRGSDRRLPDAPLPCRQDDAHAPPHRDPTGSRGA